MIRPMCVAMVVNGRVVCGGRLLDSFEEYLTLRRAMWVNISQVELGKARKSQTVSKSKDEPRWYRPVFECFALGGIIKKTQMTVSRKTLLWENLGSVSSILFLGWGFKSISPKDLIKIETRKDLEGFKDNLERVFNSLNKNFLVPV